jgi:hypothetical protein
MLPQEKRDKETLPHTAATLTVMGHTRFAYELNTLQFRASHNKKPQRQYKIHILY